MFNKIPDAESIIVQDERAKLKSGPRECIYLMQDLAPGQHEEFIGRYEDRFTGNALQTLVSEIEERADQHVFVLIVALPLDDQSTFREEVIAWSILEYVGDRKVVPLISDWCAPDDKAALAVLHRTLVKREQLDPKLAIPEPATVFRIRQIRVPPHMDFRA